MSDELVTMAPEGVGEPVEPPKPTAAPIRSRFLFVDIAAQRAKQLRRGARPRVEGHEAMHRLERVAMREVREGFVEWSMPVFKGAPGEGL